MMNHELLEEFYSSFDEKWQQRIDEVVKILVKAKEEHKKIAVVTGSGPNIHEGVTTLIAELINKNIIEGGILTSSAVIAHEMGGALDKVKRVKGADLDFGNREVWLPKGDVNFELTVLTPAQLDMIKSEMDLDIDLIKQLNNVDGKVIIKAAGNMAYPMGLRTEILAEEICKISKEHDNKYSLEYIAGLGADPLTMIGAGAANDVPVLVSIPQMIGGGCVGLSVGDTLSIHERCKRNSQILADSDVIIESGLALAQEIHDGPFETYTGHGIWSQWMGDSVYSLKGKQLIRFDLDENLEKVWQQQRADGLVQRAIADGKPKTKLSGVPFRMEMSGFARLETSLPVVGDIGVIWPVIAAKVAEALNVKLDFMAYKQETEEGMKMRDWIVDHVSFVDKTKMLKGVDKLE